VGIGAVSAPAVDEMQVYNAEIAEFGSSDKATVLARPPPPGRLLGAPASMVFS